MAFQAIPLYALPLCFEDFAPSDSFLHPKSTLKAFALKTLRKKVRGEGYPPPNKTATLIA